MDCGVRHDLGLYHIILTLHTVGFALVVGAAVVMDLRLLGLAQRAPVTAFAFLFRVMWIGFGVNALTGSILFAIAATTKAVQVVFWIKLALVAVALLITKLIAPAVRRPPDDLDDFVVPRRAGARRPVFAGMGSHDHGRPPDGVHQVIESQRGDARTA